MRILPTTLTVSLLLWLAAGAARADGLYFTEQLGVARVGGQLGRFYGGGLAGHIGLGGVSGAWAVEGYADLAELDGKGIFEGNRYDSVAWGVDVRRMFPVSPWVRMYVRGGLQHMSVDNASYFSNGIGGNYSGRGVDYGGGVMLSGRVPLLGFLFSPLFFCDCGPKVSAGAWLDVGEKVVALHRDRASSLDGVVQTWLLGFSVGGAF